VKKEYQDIWVERINWDKGDYSTIAVRNEFFFTDLSGYEGRWDILADGEVIHKGDSMRLDSIGPQDVQAYSIFHAIAPQALQRNDEKLGQRSNVAPFEPQPGVEYFYNFTFTKKGGHEPFPRGMVAPLSSVPAGHVVAWEQLQLPIYKEPAPRPLATESADTILKTTPKTDFWRAPTDNDRGNNFANRHGIWRSTPEGVKAELTFANGIVKLNLEKPEKMIDPPRIGTRFAIPVEFDQVEYYGRGPDENYWDRKEGSLVGRYKTTVDAMYVKDYTVPGECGYRTDVRWVAFRNKAGEGFLFCSMPTAEDIRARAGGLRPPVKGKLDPGTIAFGATRFSREEMEQSTHPYQLTKRNEIFVNIDLGQMGVGGDDSWGAQTHDEFRFKEAKYSLQYRVVALKPGDDPAALAR
jgi:beta-galactosidase